MNTMKLWTIQTEPAWNSLQRKGYLRGKRSYADRTFLPAYDWLSEQMLDRIGMPPCPSVNVPIWAWQQYDGLHKKRPDLRSTGHLPSGTTGYRICFTVPDNFVLLSDFELWHYVLNYCYLATSESDAESFDRSNHDLSCSWSNPPSDQKIDSEIRGSWLRIFDLNWYDPFISYPRSEKSIQGTLWQLDRIWVTAVDKFVAR